MHLRILSIVMTIFLFFLSNFSYIESVQLMNSSGEEVCLFDKGKKISGNVRIETPQELDEEINKSIVQSNEKILRCSSDSDSDPTIIDTSYLLLPSSVSENYINNRLKGTDLDGLGHAFKDAERKYGVNALFLVSLAMHESNVGKSRIAKAKNNIFGFQAYDSSPFASSRYFESKEDCIDYVAGYVSKNYLTPSGKYFNGYSIESMNIYYATDVNWSNCIKYRLDQLLLKY